MPMASNCAGLRSVEQGACEAPVRGPGHLL
jgi:hypothetical protein